MTKGPVTHVRICWPVPDKVCLQGGCVHCRDEPLRTIAQVTAFAEERGLAEDFRYGLAGNHGNFGVRR